ncbi:uncharacterized protein P174DRAFT_423487 [Aspergillus novofumigatus IBT 16806]|uniref:Uncharacterized protein n=1 Tax=Aspergillus novofumigatus (strain IBT 16806) TaxID=1392255 RepID=A0A2I1BZ12_ASPN1|nr:uncharacterized protein P174DRAFT_423487 [Aspergillus novofumigatus IBT 16806]PKX90617.1 hypothetical protein P174DRAFT_423487 [Aspergillus novofumigatus IBT 16806]
MHKNRHHIYRSRSHSVNRKADVANQLRLTDAFLTKEDFEAYLCWEFRKANSDQDPISNTKACTHASLVPSVSIGYTTVLAVLWPSVNFICFVVFVCFVMFVCFVTFFLLIKAFGLARPVERYNHDLSSILQRFGLNRRHSLASINSIAVGQAMLLRTLLLALCPPLR